MPPLFKLPLLYGLRFGQCQRVCHRPGAQVLGLRIQMRVNVGRGGDDTLFALVDGTVKFERKGKDRKQVSVYPVVSND